ncbi:MAG: hypothetical protein IKD76_02970 [Clostridia bacterium]|nr:hypothetical protein [Clostridia bacterium]
MVYLDDIDMKILRENFDEEMIQQMDEENIDKILGYLEKNDVDYAKDLLISSLDLFLLPAEDFIKQFEKLKKELGEDFVDKLGEDSSLIEIMYKD